MRWIGLAAKYIWIHSPIQQSGFPPGLFILFVFALIRTELQPLRMHQSSVENSGHDPNQQMNPKSYLGIDSNDFSTLIARIWKDLLVAPGAVRVFVPQHIALAGQGFVALPATEVARVPVFRHRLRVLPREDELKHKGDEKAGHCSPLWKWWYTV